MLPMFGGEDMKLTLLVVTFALVAAVCAQPAIAQNAFTPDEVKWGPAPPFLAPGAQLAVVEGDPMASSGDFTIRIKMPNGYKIAPHWHPKRENVTVISGNFKVGMGDKFDESKMMVFPAGSFAYLDPRHASLRDECRGHGGPGARHVASQGQLCESGIIRARSRGIE